MLKECYVVSRVRNSSTENYPVRAFISRKRAEEYKNKESALSSVNNRERWRIDTIDIDLEE